MKATVEWVSSEQIFTYHRNGYRDVHTPDGAPIMATIGVTVHYLMTNAEQKG